MQLRNIAVTTNKLHTCLLSINWVHWEKNKPTNTGEKGPLKIKHYYYYYYYYLLFIITKQLEYIFD